MKTTSSIHFGSAAAAQSRSGSLTLGLLGIGSALGITYFYPHHKRQFPTSKAYQPGQYSDHPPYVAYPPTMAAFRQTALHPLQFGMSNRTGIEEQGPANTTSGWGIARFRDAILGGVEQYRKLESYKSEPVHMALGQDFLRRAKSVSDKKDYYQKAEEQFLAAANSTKVRTHQSLAYRYAAIAAKSRGDTAAAESYSLDAKLYRKRAGKSQDFSAIGPVRDIQDCEQKCNSTVNKVLHVLKKILVAPFAKLEEGFRAITSTHNSSERYHKKLLAALTPFQQSLEVTKSELKSKFESLSGEDSDEEWVKDRDPVTQGSSTRKGLRHPYVYG